MLDYCFAILSKRYVMLIGKLKLDFDRFIQMLLLSFETLDIDLLVKTLNSAYPFYSFGEFSQITAMINYIITFY
jgi:hypothetical protein